MNRCPCWFWVLVLVAAAGIGGCYSTPPVANLSSIYQGIRFPDAAGDVVDIRWQDEAESVEPLAQPTELLLGTVEGAAYKDLARRDALVLAREIGARRVVLQSITHWYSRNCIPNDYDRHNRWRYGPEVRYRAWFFGSQKAIIAATQTNDDHGGRITT